MPESRLQCQKSAVGASSVTLIPTTTANITQFGEGAISQIVVSTSGATPSAFWGAMNDGVEFDVIFLRKT
jgi:hypothetical protein